MSEVVVDIIGVAVFFAAVAVAVVKRKDLRFQLSRWWSRKRLTLEPGRIVVWSLTKDKWLFELLDTVEMLNSWLFCSGYDVSTDRDDCFKLVPRCRLLVCDYDSLQLDFESPFPVLQVERGSDLTNVAFATVEVLARRGFTFDFVELGPSMVWSTPAELDSLRRTFGGALVKSSNLRAQTAKLCDEMRVLMNIPFTEATHQTALNNMRRRVLNLSVSEPFDAGWEAVGFQEDVFIWRDVGENRGEDVMYFLNYITSDSRLPLYSLLLKVSPRQTLVGIALQVYVSLQRLLFMHIYFNDHVDDKPGPNILLPFFELCWTAIVYRVLRSRGVKKSYTPHQFLKLHPRFVSSRYIDGVRGCKVLALLRCEDGTNLLDSEVPSVGSAVGIVWENNCVRTVFPQNVSGIRLMSNEGSV